MLRNFVIAELKIPHHFLLAFLHGKLVVNFKLWGFTVKQIFIN